MIVLWMAVCLAVVLAAVGGMLVYLLGTGLSYITLEYIFSSSVGIFPMILTSLLLTAGTVLLVLPVGIATALYLNEFRQDERFTRILDYCLDTLSGIPPILYGLFGFFLFSRGLGFGQSILSGSATLGFMTLPLVIRSIQQALQQVPPALRGGAASLGASRLQTTLEIVLPAALPGIISTVLKVIGRIAGEAAPVLLTVGTARNLPAGVFDSGRTLSVHVYYAAQEAVTHNDFGAVAAAAAVLAGFSILMHFLSRVKL